MSTRRYPLTYRMRELLAGKGCVAEVEIRGRALLEADEDPGWWVDAADTGGIPVH